MGKTATYRNDCSNKVGRTEDSQIQEAEKAGQAPMTSQGICRKCNNNNVVNF